MSLFKKEKLGVEVQGQELKCLVCGNTDFAKRRAQLNTAGAELINLAWADQSATCYVCQNCGYIHWFLK